MIGFGIFSAIFYFLFIRGWLFKMIIWVFAYIGLYLTLHLYVDGADHALLTLSQYSFSWAEVIPLCVLVLALFTSRRKDHDV
jgi:hypothetical protein